MDSSSELEEKIEIDDEIKEKIERGRRIRDIRENELHLNKLQLGEKIGVSGQFIGKVESGKGNLVYSTIRKLMRVSGHSSDYILYGLDDSLIKETKKLLDSYSDEQIIESINSIKNLCLFMKGL